MNTLPQTRRRFLATLAVTPFTLTPLRALALGGICLGIAVIIVGAIIVYFLVKWCKNIKPRRLPNPFVADRLSHARLHLINQQCPAGTTTSEATGTLDVTFDPTGRATIERRDGTHTQAESIDWLAGIGLEPEKPSASLYGQPIALTQSPISLSTPGGEPASLTVAGPVLRHVAVQRSLDLATWETVFTAQIPTTHQLRFCDLDDGAQKFYRMVTL
jgi:hypothetical protein